MILLFGHQVTNVIVSAQVLSKLIESQNQYNLNNILFNFTVICKFLKIILSFLVERNIYFTRRTGT